MKKIKPAGPTGARLKKHGGFLIDNRIIDPVTARPRRWRILSVSKEGGNWRVKAETRVDDKNVQKIFSMNAIRHIFSWERRPK